MIELEAKSGKKPHEESFEKFLSGGFGKIYRKELLEYLVAVMNGNGAATLEMKNRFFEPGMGYEDGDVEILISLKLKKIGEEEQEGDYGGIYVPEGGPALKEFGERRNLPRLIRLGLRMRERVINLPVKYFG